jgi:hypothetical protein
LALVVIDRRDRIGIKNSDVLIHRKRRLLRLWEKKKLFISVDDAVLRISIDTIA